ncbi:hypothetical protein GCM10009847_01700 [Leucobacter tardus]
MGAALAALLVLSASPAWAQDATTPDPAVDQEAEVDVPAEESSESTPATAPPTEEPAQPEPTEQSNEERDTSEPDGSGGEDSSENGAEVSDEVDVTGIVMMTPDEPHHSEDVVDELSESGGGVAIATEEGPIIPIDPASIEGQLEPGADFDGSVTLSDSVQEAVDDELNRDAAPSDDEVLEALSSVAIASEEYLPAAGTLAAAQASASKKHLVDIAWVNGGSAPGYTALQNMVRSSSGYWSGQTSRSVDGLSITNTRSFTYADRCNYWGAWDAAARQFGRTAYDYQGRNAARHLVVFMQSGGCGWAGMGTLGSLHSGGMVWVDLAVRPGGTAVSRAQPTLDHEFGHNFGLGHSHARHCSGARTDTATQAKSWPSTGGTRQVPLAPCSDIEYGDHWSPMGFDNSLRTTKSPSLTIPQREALGVLQSGSLQNVSSSAGVTQTFTLRSLDQGSGLRGLKVKSPTSGGDFYVEYRSGAGQDSGVPWSNGDLWYTPNVQGTYISTGLRVVKGYPETWSGGRELRTSVIAHTVRSGPDAGKHYTIKPGQGNGPYGATVRVTNVSNTRTTATVRIDFKGFRSGGKKVTTSVVGGGSATPGKDVKAALSGSWTSQLGTPTKITESYQWLRNGKAISGATKSTYRLSTADAGQQIAVKVVPSASGFISGAGSQSAATKVSSAPQAPSTTRFAGKDRFASAAAISKNSFPKTTGGTVVVTVGANIAEALSAAPLATQLKGPLLLVEQNRVPAATKTELNRLKPKRVIVVGSTRAVSQRAANELKATGRTIERVAGNDQYSTSIAVMKRGWPNGTSRAFVASGTRFLEPIAASAAAGSAGAPLILVPGSAAQAPATTLRALKDAGVKRIDIAGGSGGVSSGIERSLRDGRSITRHSGASSAAVSASLARNQHTRGGDISIASSSAYPEAMAGAAAAGSRKSPLVFAQPTCILGPVADAITVVSPKRIWLVAPSSALGSQVQRGDRCAS